MIYRTKHTDIVTLKALLTSCLLFRLRGKKHKISESKNEAKQNWYEFPCAGAIIKCLEGIEKMTNF